MLSIKKIKPLFTSLITTMNVYENDEMHNGIISGKKQKGTIKEYQTVVAVGDCVRNIKPGDVVVINPTRFAVKKHKEGSLKDGVITDNPVVQYRFDVVDINNVGHLLLQDRDIEYIIEDYEETEESDLIHPNKDIIL